MNSQSHLPASIFVGLDVHAELPKASANIEAHKAVCRSAVCSVDTCSFAASGR